VIAGQPILKAYYNDCQPESYDGGMCFEVLGFDVMVDTDLKPYLLEINHTPSFSTETPLDSLLKVNLIRDTLRLLNINMQGKRDILVQQKKRVYKKLIYGTSYPSSRDIQDIVRAQEEKRDIHEALYHGAYRRLLLNVGIAYYAADFQKEG